MHSDFSALDAELERIRRAHREPAWRRVLAPLRLLALLFVPMLVALLWALPFLPVVLVVGLLLVAGALGLGYTYK